MEQVSGTPPLSYKDLRALKQKDPFLYRQTITDILDKEPYCTDPKFLALGAELLWVKNRSDDALHYARELRKKFPHSGHVVAMHMRAIFNIQNQENRYGLAIKEGLCFLGQHPTDITVPRALFRLYKDHTNRSDLAIYYGDLAVKNFLEKKRSEDELQGFKGSSFYRDLMVLKQTMSSGCNSPAPISPEI